MITEENGELSRHGGTISFRTFIEPGYKADTSAVVQGDDDMKHCLTTQGR